MQRKFSIVALLMTLAVVVSACAPQATPVAAPVDTQAPPAPASTEAPAAAAGPSGPAMVAMAKNDQYGSFLADDKGMTLYLYTKDSPGTSVCYDKCATAWPPLLTSGAPVPGDGTDDSKFGTTARTDGTTQVTYNGWPLYYYFKDKAPGDTTGQNVGSVWYLVSRDGEAIK